MLGLHHSTVDGRQKERDEVLNTTKEDIQMFADMIRDVMEQDYFCILGSEGKIKENRDIFKKLINVFNFSLL